MRQLSNPPGDKGRVLEAVTRILERRAEPMRVREVHREVEREFDDVVPFLLSKRGAVESRCRRTQQV